MAISINNSNRHNNDLKLTQYDEDFVNYIINEISLYGELPHSIPQRQIVEIIRQSARWFFKHYYGAWEQKHFLLRKKDISDYLKTGNSKISQFMSIDVKLPPQIRIVKSVRVIGSTLRNSDDFAYSPLSYGASPNGMISGTSSVSPLEMWGVGNSGYGINNNLFIIENVVKMVEARAMDAFFKKNIGFNFTKLSSTLTFRESINSDVMLIVLCDIDIKYLYEDPYFIRHVISMCHQALKRKLGGFTVELNSGATMNVEEICNKIDDAKEIEDFIKSGSGLGTLLVARNS